jgi:hypothetical protein
LDNHKIGSAIVGFALWGVVGIYGLRLAKAACKKARSSYAIGNEEIADGAGAGFGEGHVFGIGTYIIGMSVYLDAQGWVFLEEFDEAQELYFGVVAQGGGGCFKKHIAQGDSFVFIVGGGSTDVAARWAAAITTRRGGGGDYCYCCWLLRLEVWHVV